MAGRDNWFEGQWREHVGMNGIVNTNGTGTSGCEFGRIGTGSTAIDLLLAPNDAHSKFDDGPSMPFPVKIPSVRE